MGRSLAEEDTADQRLKLLLHQVASIQNPKSKIASQTEPNPKNRNG